MCDGDTFWKCKTCSKKNSFNDRCCVICKRENQLKPKKVNWKLVDRKWTCTVCTNYNFDDEVECRTCKRPKGYIREQDKYLPFHPRNESFQDALRSPIFEYKRVSALLAAGIPPDDQDSKGWAGIHWACALGRDDLLQLFLAAGSDVNLARNDGYTPLHVACHCGHLKCVQILVDNEADKNSLTTPDGLTPMHIAAENGFESLVGFLIKKSAHGNCQSARSKRTPLHLACLNGHLETVKVLLSVEPDKGNAEELDVGHYHTEHRVNIGAYDVDGWTPYHLAGLRGHHKVCDILKRNGCIEADMNGSNVNPTIYAFKRVTLIEDGGKVADLERIKLRCQPVQRTKGW